MIVSVDAARTVASGEGVLDCSGEVGIVFLTDGLEGRGRCR